MSQPDLFLKATLFAAAFDNHEILADENPPDWVGEFFKKASLGLLGEGNTPRVNPADERLHREMAAIDNRFAGMYKAIAAEETTTFKRDNLWQPEQKSRDRLAKGAPLQLFIRLSKID